MPLRSVDGQNDQSGFILIFVLATCLLLAVLALIVGRSLHAAVINSGVTLKLAKARALADGGVALASARLTSVDGAKPFTCTVSGVGQLAVSIEDEAGKVSLNSENAALLTALFQGLGATRDEAQHYVAVLADYRDADSSERADGAEEQAYLAAGQAFGPRNSNFETVSELDRVYAIPAAMRLSAKRYLTAATSANGVDGDAAPSDLVKVLNRGAGGGGQEFATRVSLPPGFSARSTRTIFKIRSIAVVDGARFLREALVRRSAESNGAFQRFGWLQGEITAEDEADLSALDTAPPC